MKNSYLKMKERLNFISLIILMHASFRLFENDNGRLSNKKQKRFNFMLLSK